MDTLYSEKAALKKPQYVTVFATRTRTLSCLAFEAREEAKNETLSGTGHSPFYGSDDGASRLHFGAGKWTINAPKKAKSGQGKIVLSYSGSDQSSARHCFSKWAPDPVKVTRVGDTPTQGCSGKLL